MPPWEQFNNQCAYLANVGSSANMSALDWCSDWRDPAHLQRRAFSFTRKQRTPAELGQCRTLIWLMHLVMHLFAEGATGFSPLCLRTGRFPGEKRALCFHSGSFIYLFYIMINCTVFWENEIVHVKIKEPQSGRTQYGKQLEHLKIKGRNRNDKEFEEELISSSSSQQTKKCIR